MGLKVDWKKIRKIQESLSELSTINDETEIVFLMIVPPEEVKKSVIKFKDFMRFFWAIENADYTIQTLVVQDKEGRILYRHKWTNVAGEEIPVGGNTNIIKRWSSFSQTQKNSFIRLLVAQIHGHA